MEIIIKKILEQTPTGVHVWFDTELGSGKAEWQGDIPAIGKKYFVELDVDDELTWGDNVVRIDSNESLIRYENDKMIIQGKIDQIYEDGILILRLQGSTHSDSIMIELGNPNFIKIGDCIRLMARNTKLFDMNL